MSSESIWENLAYEYNDLEKMTISNLMEILNPKLKPYKVYFILYDKPNFDVMLPFYFKEINTYGYFQVSDADGAKIERIREIWRRIIKMEFNNGKDAYSYITRNKPDFADVIFRNIGNPKEEQTTKREDPKKEANSNKDDLVEKNQHISSNEGDSSNKKDSMNEGNYYGKESEKDNSSNRNNSVEDPYEKNSEKDNNANRNNSVNKEDQYKRDSEKEEKTNGNNQKSKSLLDYFE